MSKYYAHPKYRRVKHAPFKTEKSAKTWLKKKGGGYITIRG